MGQSHSLNTPSVLLRSIKKKRSLRLTAGKLSLTAAQCLEFGEAKVTVACQKKNPTAQVIIENTGHRKFRARVCVCVGLSKFVKRASHRIHPWFA